ncbi:SDR family NAD(P)-dependent oxidoreductase [Dickeya oryzae]|uniref:SDR family NAD(P)-dependent oxidoreductase n=1 Tax=Dickeya oryzae TaxID=1240404 RepID=A0ABS5BAK0_9GAMM|nr:SDR family NAD(P)-dependent oxidoreductase [Dickeya oryzae]MBP2857475.1 SDR family NAD(P)-dependent oxidoreductase [Dickeya oryzae]
MNNQSAPLSFIEQWIQNHKTTTSSDSVLNMSATHGKTEPLAITGLAGYFPQCMSVAELWRHLDADDALITELPQQRKMWYQQGKTGGEASWAVLSGGFIPDIASFDPAKFGILPIEAEEMDPRQRLLLMSTYHMLEDAGISPESLRKTHTGVFIGCESNEYAALMTRHGYRPEFGLAQADSMIANRISYQFDLAGPSELINATCAGFAVALHRATLALRAGVIDRAIIGAANVILVPDVTNRLNDSKQLTHGKTVHSFGKHGDGFIRSEGVGTILLERQADAEQAGRRVYAIIKHTQVNFNGQGGVSMASPNTDAHCELIKDCYREAGIDPRRVSYIEAQGMGLPVADIAEWTAMNRALSQLCEEQGVAFEAGYCRVSSLKPLLGHMHSASSLGALLKVIRSLQTDKIHKILGFEHANDYCDTQGTPCCFATETQAWPTGEHPRLAAIHSYGSGGNNAHILVEEYQGVNVAGADFPSASARYAFAREYYWFQFSPSQKQPDDEPLVHDKREATHSVAAEQDVLATIGRLLGLNGSDNEIYHQAFTELGLDSVSVSAFVSRLEAAYPVKLRRSDLFSYTTPMALARMIAERMQASGSGAERRHGEASPQPARRGNDDNRTDDIAIIGIDINVAGADNPAEFWQLLREGRCSIGPVPDSRRLRDDLQMKTLRGGFMTHIDHFDPLFFKISPREARNMDPHHRLLLQSAWRAIEDAGYDPYGWYGQKHGIFVGMEESDYPLTENSAITSVHTGTAPARIGYFLDTKGPLLAIGTACSSSLVAVHYACQSILNGESELALAGGCNLICQPERMLHALSRMGDMLSPDGTCYAFDYRANGMVVGEGCATVVLKRHADALRDGDDIYAIIKGSGINYDGKTNGLTAPNGARQSELYAQVYRQSGVSPEQIGYVVSHGTGTMLGDPIECNALIDAFHDAGADKKQYCALTSPKTNIGHTQAASGIVNVITAALALKHQEIPPSLNYAQPNEDIDFADSPFYVNTTLKHWEQASRFAAVSAFGHSGTNVHLVLQNAEAKARCQGASGEDDSYLIVLSAKSEPQLKQIATNLIAGHAPESMRDLAYTLQFGRTAMPHRLALIADGWHTLQEKVRRYLTAEEGASSDLGLYYADVSGTARSRATEALLCAEGSADSAPGVRDDDISPLVSKQLACWLRGEPADWGALYHGPTPRRMHLPTYPFEQESYWIATVDSPAMACSVATPSAPTPQSQKAEPGLRHVLIEPDEAMTSEQDDAVLVYRERWQEQSLPDVPGPAERQIQRLLCVTPAAAQTAIRLGINHIATNVSTEFFAPDDLAATEASTYHRYFSALKRAAQTETVAALLCVVEPESAMNQLVPLFQGLLSSGLDVGRIVVASAFTSVLERCYADALVAFGASLRVVLPKTRVTFAGFELTDAADTDQWQSLAEHIPDIWAELQTEPAQSVLYIQGKRHVLTFEPTRLENAESALKTDSYLKIGGCYLITGGLGGLGTVFARYLCENVMAKVLLVGRSPLDVEKQADLRAIEQHGGQVTYLQADVSELSQMQSLFADCQRKGIKINGILHTAGVQTTQMLAEKDLAGVRQVLAPKIQGTLVLDTAWQTVFGAEDPLDFIVYFSSSAAVLGDFGAGDYAVANRFQLAYANNRNQPTAPEGKTPSLIGKTIAISWPVWQDGGMTQRSVERAQATSLYLKTSGQRALRSEEGLRVFEQLLAGEAGSSLVMVGQPDKIQRVLGDRLQHESGTRQERLPRQPVTTTIARRPEMKGLTVEQCVLWELQQAVSDILSIERHRLHHDVNLADFGFDSISLAEFATCLSRKWSIVVSPALFFGNATLSQLCQYFMLTHGALMQTYYGGSAGHSEVSDHRVESVHSGAPLNIPPVNRSAIGEEHRHDVSPFDAEEPIAIIGMSGRFPGARDIDEMWRYLAEGKSAVSRVSAEYLHSRDESYRDSRIAASDADLWCGVVPGAAEFDPLFFEISPREAQNMDPGQRLLLQEAWSSLEHAGYGAQRLRQHNIGTFVGVEEGAYGRFSSTEHIEITANHNGILASRLAYFLDLHGPVLAINTACSSGLVAAHLACTSLRNRECDTALAAGVSLQLSTEGFDIMKRSGMISADGICYTFDQRANGMVPGEAVVVLVLKRLSQAEADGDLIHGLIRASGINYDGKTNGITAPNGVAQADLLKTVYQRAHIDPAQIDYIVTHGTGTRLGDPVEINALNEAFKAYTDKQAFCALTSTKTNFGHTFAASGLLSAVSLLQSMNQQTIPASLHCQQENDYITWAESPFYVNKTARAWPVQQGRLRMGAVSAFGMSGTNAHLVMQEYPQPVSSPEPQRSHYLLCLSAKTEEALYRKVEDLILHLQKPQTSTQGLAAIGYTLLQGRSHFQYRLAVVAEDRDGVIISLRQAEHAQRPNLFRGKVPLGFVGQKIIRQQVDVLLQQSQQCEGQEYQEILSALADYYCQGYELDGAVLSPEVSRCVALPTYPFAREHHWLETRALSPSSDYIAGARQSLHPLLTENASTLAELRFRAEFSGEEFFLVDHQIHGRKVLPGVSYLEMARAAYTYAAASVIPASQRLPFSVKQVLWLQPIVATQPTTTIYLGLYAQESGLIDYQIYSENDIQQRTIHGQGIIDPHLNDTTSGNNALERNTLDLHQLKKQMTGPEYPAAHCYQRFREMGLNYGETFQGIERLLTAERQVLAQIVLPDAATSSAFGLHPSLMDAALQTSLGLHHSDLPSDAAYVPFALEQLDVFGEMDTRLWVWLRLVSTENPANEQVQKMDIDLCNDQGRICVSMRGFSTRILPVSHSAEEPVFPGIVTSVETAASAGVTVNIKHKALSGTEYFLQDHGGLLPGMLSLEWMRELAVSHVPAGDSEVVVGLRDVVWHKPLMVGEQGTDIDLALNRDEQGYHCVISRQGQVHAQGRVMTGLVGNAEHPPLPLADIEHRCRQHRTHHACAEFFGAGIGPRLLGITQYAQGNNEALVTLDIHQDLVGAVEEPVLHPALMNGAVLASIILAVGGERQGAAPLMPFSLDALRIYQPLPARVLAYIRQTRSDAGSEHRIVRCDIWFTDHHGHILVEINGLSMISAQASPAGSLVVARPQWVVQDIVPAQVAGDAPDALPPCFILADENAALQTALQNTWPDCQVVNLSVGHDSHPQQFTSCLQQLFAQIKTRTLACRELAQRQTVFILASEPANELWLSASAGLLKTARQEQSGFNGNVIRYPASPAAIPLLLTQLQSELHGAKGATEIRYDETGSRRVKAWQRIAQADMTDALPVSSGCVIWITGGLGGIGYQIARELGTQYQARLVLSGRSALNERSEQRLLDLQRQGIQATYLQGDVTDPAQTRHLVQQILQDEGQLNGIIHSAGIIRDAFIANKTQAELLDVLAPKVAGTLALDHATQDCNLDFMVLFSSLSSAFGNAGQADYACANGFMDGFALWRNQQVANGLRRGKTLAVNWPLWRDGGMGISAPDAELLRQQTGLIPMPTEVGIQALMLGLQSQESQLAVIYGEAEKIQARLAEDGQTPPQPSSVHQSGINDAAGLTKEVTSPVRVGQVCALLVSMVAQLQKLDEKKIELDMELSRYGFNSIDFTEFASRLNKAYGLALMPTVFFEHSTLRRMGNYLADTYPEAFADKTAVASGGAGPRAGMATTSRQLQSLVTRTANTGEGRKAFSWRASPPILSQPTPAVAPLEAAVCAISNATVAEEGMPLTPNTPQVPEAIAIIGMSGRFPQSRNLDAFWQQLEANRDLIGQVPADRWNWQEYYGDPHETPGKTKVTCGGFMQDVDCFDPLFFGISPREAQSLDPQFRVFLETVWATIEDAGYCASDLSGSNTGVFVGVSTSEYKDAWLKYSHDKFGIGDPPWLSHFALANRVSYILNLHGPSEPIDTACSSSLVAIHRAIEAIRSGSCDVAIVGGVNVIVNPGITITAGEAGILSEDGRCKTFDISADGYGRGEGVGAIMLKPLSQAKADGDRIHGLIRGSAENHGGKATSPTAPNPVAQQELLVQAYRRSGIDPETVGYIETHGTGTKLGDPIEINGLNKAFATLYREQNKAMTRKAYCGLGSVKTNIGHLEAAAGISGVLKILLMFRHRKIPGNVHLKTANPYLDLADSPFYLARETQAWPAMENADGQPVPRRAGVSSFGIGGANAHIVLEEYASAAQTVEASSSSAEPVAIVLSAKKAERLGAVVQGLAAFLDSAECAAQQPSLTEIAYTLQVGREAMDERLAFVTHSVQALKQTLAAYLSEAETPAGVYRGNVKVGKASLSMLADDDAWQTMVGTWLQTGNYNKLLDVWVKGGQVDWQQRYPAAVKPRRIGLPTYPFARDRFWLKVTGSASESHGSEATESPVKIRPYRLHPLVHRNTSDITALSFTSWFDGREFFLADHRVMEQKLLPGVAYLEMARAAAEQVVGAGRHLQLTQIVWVRPFVAEHSQASAPSAGIHPLTVKLLPQSAQVIRFDIGSVLPDGQMQTHCQGNVLVVDPCTDGRDRLDLSVALAEHQDGTIDKAACYQAFRQLGIVYGPGHQGVETLYLAKGRVLARLSLPETLRETLNDYVLHPSLMDSALQATLGLSREHRLGLPFDMASMDILHRCTATMWACVTYDHGTEPHPQAKVQKLTIKLYDDAGQLCVALHGFSARTPESATTQRNGTLLLVPQWQRKNAPVNTAAPPTYTSRQVLFCVDRSIGNDIGLTDDVVLPVQDTGDIALNFHQHALALFAQVQAMLASKPKQPVLLQLVVVGDFPTRLLAALNGLLKTARLENANVIGQLIELDVAASAEDVDEKLRKSSLMPEDIHIRYGREGRQVLSWREVCAMTGGRAVSPSSALPPFTRMPWKEQGVYLITGGAGGLGLIFATEIARQTRKARLILTGRSAMTPRIQTSVSQLEALGAQVDYRTLDVCDRPGVEALITAVTAQYGTINGVLHCAGVLRDSYILKKSAADFQAVLAPKVQGVVNLDQALAQHPLDFFILFSSTAAGLGNPGQADYVTANSFMDAYAHYRQQQVATQSRMGRTLAINWPLWKEGGMKVDDAFETMMYQSTGMIAMSTQAGLQAFYQAIARDENQVLVIAGDIEMLRQTLSARSSITVLQPEKADETRREDPVLAHQAQGAGHLAAIRIDRPGLESAVQQLLIREISALLDVDKAEIDVDLELTELGFDSILTTGFANKLNRQYELDLLPTVFFEYPTISALSGYLTETYQAVFAAKFTDFSHKEGTHDTFARHETVSPSLAEHSDQAAADFWQPAPAGEQTVSRHTALDIQALREAIQSLLLQEVSTLLQVNVADIDTDIELNELGFDSILTTGFANKLNRQYTLDLLPTVFFEYPTIAGLTAYLAENYQESFSHLFAAKVMVQPSAQGRIQPANAADDVHPVGTPSSPASVSKRDEQEAIAIVGMSGSFPMAPDLDAYWDNLLQGKDCISEVPPIRWNWRDYLQEVEGAENKDSIRWGGFIQDMAEFDPLFFGISPREAELMDPQQRLLMTHVWKVIEDAGYSASSLSGSALGIYVGTGNTGYSGLIVDAKLPAEGFTATGIVPSIGPNRMSYFLNVHGPSEPIETACSSSLIAIHRGVSALRHEGCDMVIVGGINTLVTPDTFVSFCKAGMLASDGRCKTFSSKADGYVRGEGVGMLLLKRLSAAEADGDHIYGVIRGSAQNHGGRASSLTAPNPKAQVALLESAYRNAGIDPRSISYIEAHGTGTKLGDPIEINSLKTAFNTMKADYSGEEYSDTACGIGSVKTNIGHLEMAAGIAGVIKVLLQMKHQTLVKSLHYEEPNPYIDFTGTPFYIVSETRPWHALKNARGETLPRRAGVSSFGFGGANAHVVIEEYRDTRPARQAVQDRYVVLLSAKDDVRLRRVAQNLRQYLAQHREDPDLTLGHLAYTLQVGRDAMEARLGWIVTSFDELLAKMDGFLNDTGNPDDTYRGHRGSHKGLLAQFSADEELSEAIAKWAERGKYARLLNLWCQGLEFDWSGLYQGQRPRRLSLPTYPFDCQRFWLPEGQGQRRVVARLSDDNGAHLVPEQSARVPSSLSEDVAPEGANPPFNLDTYLIQLISRQLKVSEEVMSPDRALEELGMDSVVSVDLLNKLRKTFPDVSRSLFMEYRTIGEIQHYLRSHFGEQLATLGSQALPTEPWDAQKQADPQKRVDEKIAVTGEGPVQNISIIGMAGIFPQAENISEFWENLSASRTTLSVLSDKRRYLMALDEQDSGSRRIGGYLDGVEYFDHKLFKVPHKEAQKLDPQMRKLLEVIWQAVADAGYTLSQFREKRTGLFVATRGHSGYQDIPARQDPAQMAQWRFQAEQISAYANRISNILNLSGLSEIVETGCASFLVAIRHAMSAIKEGRCEQAIVATAELGLSPFIQNRTDDQALYSSHPVTKSFAHDSDGYVKSEVVGAIILKAEAEALVQGDAIYANVKGVGISHGGKAPLKWYSPNIEGQKSAIVAAFSEAGIDPATVSYIEPEANGSQLGDASELVAIQAVYGPYLQESNAQKNPIQASNIPAESRASSIAIGSLKPLTGHAETASTFPVLVKMVLSMYHRRLAKIEGLGELNEGITLTDGFELLREERAWEKHDHVPRRGAIHSMSIGGVNAHLLLEEYEAEQRVELFKPSSRQTPRPFIFLFSESDEARLNTLVSDYLDFLPRAQADIAEGKFISGAPTAEKQPATESVYLEQLAYTLQQGREHRAVRLAVSAASIAQLQERLQRWRSRAGNQTDIYDSRHMSADIAAGLSHFSDDMRHVVMDWLAGHAVDWTPLRQAQGQGEGIQKLHLPVNPLQKVFCWHDGFDDIPANNENGSVSTGAEPRSVVE